MFEAPERANALLKASAGFVTCRRGLTGADTSLFHETKPSYTGNKIDLQAKIGKKS